MYVHHDLYGHHGVTENRVEETWSLCWGEEAGVLPTAFGRLGDGKVVETPSVGR